MRPADITAPIVHATTLITNALIEGKIGKAGVVTTTGFGDTLEIRDEHRYDMYDLQIEFPRASGLARFASSRSASERIRSAWSNLCPMPLDWPRSTEQLRAAGVEAVGICLINSYANPANESRRLSL